MSESHLIAHAGARVVSREELDEASKRTPAPTRTWYPVSHSNVLDSVGATLREAGFEVRRSQIALMRDSTRMFTVLDLSAPLVSGVTLSVGLRNSVDKSLPLGFCAGNRVFVCDNLAFRSELMVHRKHTRFGRERFAEAITLAVRALGQFQAAESARIRRFQSVEVSRGVAESAMLRAFEEGIVSHRLLPELIKSYRKPPFEEFADPTLWSLENHFTGVLAPVFKANPQRFCRATMRLQALLADAAGLRAAEDAAPATPA